MKKILILLLLFIPLLTNAQCWYVADAMNMDNGKGWEGWKKCKTRIYTDEDTNVKIFTSDNTIVYRSLGNHDAKDENGINTLSWECVNSYGTRCNCYLIYNMEQATVFFVIEYPNMKMCFNVMPEQ
jgi:hypothetical protein